MRNPARDPAWTCRPAPSAVAAFHRALPGYEPTPLRRLGASRVYVKQEANRLGLPAFKALGASWAIHRALRDRPPGPAHIVTATEGNHGRAVARYARAFGHRATVYVPAAAPAPAVARIEREGAAVIRVPGDYDTAVRAAAAVPGALLVQDTAWPGYERIPSWIVEGYSTLFAELDAQLPAAPDAVLVPTGVGSLLQAALTHYRGAAAPGRTAIVSVEPATAACVRASVAAGRPVTVETGATVMAGLNCGTVSSLAWPLIRPGLDECLTVTDAEALAAVRALAANGVDAGPCGAAPFAALPRLRLPPGATIVLLATESAAASAP